MLRATQLSVCVLSAAMLAAVAAASVTAQGSPGPDAALERLSLVTIRWINTTQATYRQQHGRFADLPELLLFAPRPPGWPGNDDGTPLAKPSWLEINVLVDRSNKRYAAMVGSRESCAWRYFSDDSGVISMGRPLGCERDVTTRPAR